jgi:monovalent cation/proton antiporter MnhG/PhaG subunit
VSVDVGDLQAGVGAVLLWAGVMVVVVMSVGVLVTPDLLRRLHLASATSSPGCLLVCLGLAATADTWHEAVKLVVIGLLLLLGGALGSAVVARAHESTRREGSSS